MAVASATGRYQPCSGQGYNKRRWGVWDIEGPLYWRLCNKAGRRRTFKDCKSATAMAERLNQGLEEPIPKPAPISPPTPSPLFEL